MSNLPIDTNGVDREVIDITQKIMDEQDVNKVKDMTAVFNLLQQKKNLLRVLKLNGLLDTVSDKIVQRFEQRPDEFSNSDLVAYMKVIEDAVDKANKSLNINEMEVPQVALLQQNNVSVVVGGTEQVLDRESRAKVANAIKAYMDALKSANNAGDIVQNGETNNESEDITDAD